jgi:hypothetical protein
VLVEGQIGFRRAKGTSNVIGKLGIVSERILDIDEELCMCFIDGQKEFGIVNRTKFADPKWNWYRLARKKTDQQVVHGSKCKLNWTRGDKKCEDWNKS